MHKFLLPVLLLLLTLQGCNHKTMAPEADKGMLDLRFWNLDRAVKLNGEWEFYWNRFLMQEDFLADSGGLQKDFIEVPATWNDKINLDGPATGYATYRLRVLLPENKPPNMALKIWDASSSMHVLINGKVIARSGSPGKNAQASFPSYHPEVSGFKASSDTLHLIVHVSNFNHRKGGLWEPLVIGKEAYISNQSNKAIACELFLFGAILIMGIYHLMMFHQRRNHLPLLYFGLFCFILAWKIPLTGEHALNLFIGNHWALKVKLDYISFYLAAPLFGLFLYSMYPREILKKIAYAYVILGITVTLLTVSLPVKWFSFTMVPFQIITVLLSLYASFALVLAISRRREYAGVLFTGWMLLFISVLNDIFYNNNVIHTGNYVYLGLIVFIIFKAYILSSSFSKEFRRSERLAGDLNIINENLENLVEARTLELSVKNDIIEERNKDITAGINYAKRIQEALLPLEANATLYFEDHLLMNIPKHIIGGDFFWVKQYGDVLFFAVADCTGHGVPGAFMSLMGMNLLNEITSKMASGKESATMSTAAVLNELRNRIKTSLNQSPEKYETHDGMDMALCALHLKSMKLKYSGARRPMYLIKKAHTIPASLDPSQVSKIDKTHALINIRGDRMPLSTYLREDPFKEHALFIEQGDRIFLFSDGYPDQIGGIKNKKFLEQRFKNLIISNYRQPLSEFKSLLESTFYDWKGDEEQLDDIMVFGGQV